MAHLILAHLGELPRVETGRGLSWVEKYKTGRAQTVDLQGSHMIFMNSKTKVNHRELCLGLCLRGNTLWYWKVSS